MGTKPTSRKRNRKQKAQASFTKAREELQLLGVLPTTAEGALRDERVSPASQGSGPALPALVTQALKEDWSTPAVAKPRIVGALLEPFYSEDVVLDKDGNQVRVPPNRGMLLACAKALSQMDQVQHERDNPKPTGPGTQVNVQVNTGGEIAALMAAVAKQKQVGQLHNGGNHDERQPDEPRASQEAAKPLEAEAAVQRLPSADPVGEAGGAA